MGNVIPMAGQSDAKCHAFIVLSDNRQQALALVHPARDHHVVLAPANRQVRVFFRKGIPSRNSREVTLCNNDIYVALHAVLADETPSERTCTKLENLLVGSVERVHEMIATAVPASNQPR